MTSDEEEDEEEEEEEEDDGGDGNVTDDPHTDGHTTDGNETADDEEEEEEEQNEHKTKSKILGSMRIDADDEIISDIESVSDHDPNDIAYSSNAKMKILGVDETHSDLPPPAAQNIRFMSKPGHRKTASAALPSHSRLDPNKKARIERYVMDSKQHGIHAQVMIRVLCVYARLNKGVEYVQGMNELLAPIYYIFCMDPSSNRKYAEADSFFCFMNLMSYLADRFIAESDNSQLGIIAVVNEFDELLERADYELWALLQKQQLDSKFYALRWLMLLMAMEFQLPEVLRLWDSFLSDHNRFEFVSYFALAMLEKVRPQLMAGSFSSNLQLLQKYPSFDLYELLVPAMDFRDKYPMNDADAIKLREKRERREMQQQQRQTVGRSQSLRAKSKRAKQPPRSPRDVFRKHMNSAKDLLDNMQRQASARSKSPAGRRRVAPNSYIFNS